MSNTTSTCKVRIGRYLYPLTEQRGECKLRLYDSTAFEQTLSNKNRVKGNVIVKGAQIV